MLNIAHPQHGVSLIEMMIAITLAALLLMLGLPSFNLWIQNTQTRTAAESILNGLQLARTEAVRHNTNVRFMLTDASGAVAWTVGCVNVNADCPATIQSRSPDEGGTNARAGVDVAALPSPIPVGHFNAALAAGAGLPAGVTFDGLGRVPSANVGTDISRIDVVNATTANGQRMVIVVGTGGQVRMCNPNLTLASNPQGCS